jgi:hypothetical protein
MMTDNALTNCRFLLNMQSGDTGMREAEHRNFFEVWFTHHIHSEK